MKRLPPRAPPGPEAALMPDPGPGEVPAAAAALPPPLPGVCRAGIPVTEASGQHLQDPAPAGPPKLYPPLPVSTDKKGRKNGIKQRLRSAREQEGTKENR